MSVFGFEFRDPLLEHPQLGISRKRHLISRSP